MRGRMGRMGLILRLILRDGCHRCRGCHGCRSRSFGHLPRSELAQARHVEGVELAGEGHRAVAAALLLLDAANLVLAGVKILVAQWIWMASRRVLGKTA
jgi:hypothetical protein